MSGLKRSTKRNAASSNVAAGRSNISKRQRSDKGSVSQPITLDSDTQAVSQPSSPRQALAAASQATNFELQLRNAVPEAAIVAPVEASGVATAASTAIYEGEEEVEFDEGIADNFEGIDWDRLSRFMMPLQTQKRMKSWVYNYGYRLTLRSNTKKTFWLCRICHQRKKVGYGLVDTTYATSTASRHLGKDCLITKDGKEAPKQLQGGQKSIEMLMNSGVRVSQQVANEAGHFDVQAFRIAAVSWLVNNNIALSEFEKPAFRLMLQFANPEAKRALWMSANSVSRFVLRLYNFMQPQVVLELCRASSKIHISFDGWTVKGGKRGFFGIVAHFVTAEGNLRDIAIDLPQLAGAHTGDRIADCVSETLQKFGITAPKVGYFMLDNAYNNNTAIAKLGAKYNFKASHCWLRCGAHTINFVGQSIIFGSNKDTFNNDEENLAVNSTGLLYKAG
jgi:hypothetical protein